MLNVFYNISLEVSYHALKIISLYVRSKTNGIIKNSRMSQLIGTVCKTGLLSTLKIISSHHASKGGKSQSACLRIQCMGEKRPPCLLSIVVAYSTMPIFAGNQTIFHAFQQWVAYRVYICKCQNDKCKMISLLLQVTS